MATGLEKIIALIRRTGDRCIVLDSQGNPAYVILPLDDYERLTPSRASAAAGDGLVAEMSQAAERRPTPPPEPWGPGTSGATLPGATPVDTGSDQYFFEPIA